MERTITPDALKAEIESKLIVDIRRVSDLSTSTEQLEGARWHDPENVSVWADTLPKDQDIVLYCVRGGSVSNNIVDALQAKGLKARFIAGGIEGWKGAGGRVVAK